MSSITAPLPADVRRGPVGSPIRRTEDERILTGAEQYLDDLPLERIAHVAFVRSTIAHAQITELDTAEAAAMPGVLGVFTARDLPLPPLQATPVVPPVFARPPLATDVVRFVGDAVAVVVAESPAAAVDAAELVVVDYEPLPVVVDPESALAPDAPVLFPHHDSNVVVEFDFDDPDVFADAEVVVEGRFVNQRVAPVPLETNAFMAAPEGDRLVCWAATQNPHVVRDGVAAALGLDADDVRVVAPAVGGGFGAKAFLYVEFAVVAALARRLARPVKWVETRSESMVALTHGRGQVQHVELGLTRDGRFVGLRVDVVADGGAYPSTGAFLPYLTRSMASGVYRIPRIAWRSRSVVTNTAPVASYRGAGRPEATALVERIVDLAARELGLDPVELRRRNLIPPDAFPYETPVDSTYDVGDYEAALDRALRIADYPALRREQRERRERGDVVQLGVGISCYVEVTAGGLWREHGAVEVERDGTITARVGTSPHGQGHETALAMIVAGHFGVPIEAVRIVHSDTDRIPRGMGTMGSRTIQIAGSALHHASEEVVGRGRELAAHVLGAPVDEMVVHPGGGIGAPPPSDRVLSWADLAAAADDESCRPAGMQAGLAHDLDHDQGGATYPFGAHVAVVEVDTETGRVTLRRHVAVDDCGNIINPLLADGQVHGGVAQGVAQALFEEFVYDEDGNPLTANLIDYEMPSAAELPSFDVAHTVTPTPMNALGAKGIGESGTIGSTPAVQNAVVDALAPVGVRHVDMPCSPQRVWRAIVDAKESTEGQT